MVAAATSPGPGWFFSAASLPPSFGDAIIGLCPIDAGKHMSSDQDINKRILDLLPVMLMPTDVEIDTFAIRSRLNIIDRQEQLLVIARWLYDHRDDMDKIAFEISHADGRVYLDNDEVTVSPDVVNLDKIVQDVVDLQQRLDSLVGENTEAFIEKVLAGLNKVGWDMPEAWHVLEKHAPTDDRMSGTDWLDQHRASWLSREMQQDTLPSGPRRAAAPIARM